MARAPTDQRRWLSGRGRPGQGGSHAAQGKSALTGTGMEKGTGTFWQYIFIGTGTKMGTGMGSTTTWGFQSASVRNKQQPRSDLAGSRADTRGPVRHDEAIFTSQSAATSHGGWMDLHL